MIPNITELNFPDYATLTSATITESDMGEKSITATIKIDGAIAPDFSYDWEIEYKGEKYVHSIRRPAGSKEGTSWSATYDLTFEHWAIRELKRHYFVEMTSIESGVAIANQYNASLNLDLQNFVIAFQRVLDYWYGDTFVIDLNPDWTNTDVVQTEIDYSFVWEVLMKVYEWYKVRWFIVRENDKYVIKVGYNTPESTHIFEYGFEGGLLKFQQQVQSPDIKNVILGRGGSKNLPARYFKDRAEDSGGGGAESTFPADPDWIPELADIYFDALRDANFRFYVQGWKTNVHRDTRGGQLSIEAYDEALGEREWAYKKGHFDVKFNPVEYVKDDESIAKYGEFWDGLQDNAEIFPTIQGVDLSELGEDPTHRIDRVDQVVDVEQIESDEIKKAVEDDSIESTINAISETFYNIPNDGVYRTLTTRRQAFVIPPGRTAVMNIYNITVTATKYVYRFALSWAFGNVPVVTIAKTEKDVTTPNILVEDPIVRVYDGNGEEQSSVNLTEGSYEFEVSFRVKQTTGTKKINVTIGIEGIKLIMRGLDDSRWTNTFDIWIKDLWQSTRMREENDIDFANRVWRPILSDKMGNEAKVVFASGLLAGTDYEYPIVKYAYDNTKTLSANGREYQSMWRLTLAKSEADYESTGKLVPSTKKQGRAGDYFFFIGIDMPHQYVVWNELRLRTSKERVLAEVKDIQPTYNVTLDKVRLHNRQDSEAEALINQIQLGSVLRVKDKRFIPTPYEQVYVTQIKTTYSEPSDKDAKILPDVDITLSNDVVAGTNTISHLQSQLDLLHAQYSSISNIEQIIRVIGDKLYLRKDGIADISMSPTQFVGKVTSDSFRQGAVGGAGWGLYYDGSGNAIIECDKVVARNAIESNALVVNQVSYVGGKAIESAASIQCNYVDYIDGKYYCYFDQKNGSVRNLFVVNDIAYAETYDEEFNITRYYKRLVVEVGANYIALSDAEGQKDGGGTPQENDLIIQYGNTENTDRQCAKVRDVIGGGYESFLSDLNSVSAKGIEYCFIGKRSGDNPRFFIGNRDGYYIEFQNHELSIKGKFSVESTIGDKNLYEEVSKVDHIEVGTRNLIRNSGYWTKDFGSTEPPQGWHKEGNATMLFDYTQTGALVVQDGGVNSYLYTPLRADYPLKKGTQYTLIALARSISSLSNYNHEIELAQNPRGIRLGVIAHPEAEPTELFPYRYTFTADDDYPEWNFRISTRANSTLTLMYVGLFEGNVNQSWSAAPEDIIPEPDPAIDYLKAALKQSTDITGGLVQTSVVQLGYEDTLGVRQVTAGTSGIVDPAQPGKGLAFWAGGRNIDPQSQDAGSDTEQGQTATFGVRHDGTVFAANNTVRIGENGMYVGDKVALSSIGLQVVTTDSNGNSSTPVLIADDNIDEDVILQDPRHVDTQTFSQPIATYIASSRISGLHQPYAVVFDQLNPIHDIKRVLHSHTFNNVTANSLIDINVSVQQRTYTRLNGTDIVQPEMFVYILAQDGAKCGDYTLHRDTKSDQEIVGSATQGLNKYENNNPIQFRATLPGNYTVVIGYYYRPDTYNQIQRQAEFNVSGNYTASWESFFNQKTIIGKNGLASYIHNDNTNTRSLLLFCEGLMKATINNYGLKVDQSGVYITTDGVNWKRVLTEN